MRVTTKGRYALRALVKLALDGSGKPIPIKKLAEAEEISPEFLEQIFFRLKKAGIIDSVRGPGGGFILRRDPEEITVRAIFDAVGEGIELTPCTTPSHNGATQECDRAEQCLMHDVWQEVSSHITSYFEQLTLQKILQRSREETAELLV
ncbi:MAG: RrF2 family transcriptional regulator [Spirochaetaceae bacterium]